jgi:N-acetylglucosaminyl-diphospho-decaprenol L-rhamnosyltransferase
VRDVGGFDTSWFMYGDDVDLGARLTDAGWKLSLVPTASGRHLIAGTQGGIDTRWIEAIHQIYARHASRAAVAVFDLIAFSGLGVRAVALLAASSTEERVRAKRMRVSAARAGALFARTLRGPL